MSEPSAAASGSFTARPGPDLHAAMIEVARREGVSLSAWTNDLFSRAVGRPAVIPRSIDDLRTISSLTGEQADELRRINGLVTIVAGPTSSGKTTLIKALLRDHAGRRRRQCRIAVVSGTPEEYRFSGVDVMFFDVVLLVDEERNRPRNASEPVASEEEIAGAVASNLAHVLQVMDFDVVVMDGHERLVYGKLGTALVEAARADLTFIIETHASAATQATERLRELGMDIGDDDVAMVVFADRDPSTGRVSYSTKR
jgi:hypothetical protein